VIQEKARGEKHRNFLLVRSGESRFALPVSIVERIVHDLPYHSVPGAQPRLLGLAQFAGEPLPVLHLRAAVEGGEVTDTGTWSIIIVSHRNRADRSLLGLAVGEVLNICQIALTEESDGCSDSCASETVELEGQTAKVVDVDFILGRETRNSGAING
jgi:chemotaxis signal transduction protein